MSWYQWIQPTLELLGVPRNTTSHKEKCLSALGAVVGIFVVSAIGAWLQSLGILDRPGSLMVIASIGASAVLLFAVPHGALSQPWALVGGHTISAFIGVSCYLVFSDTHLSAALAVGVAVGAMYYLRCIHPPGGATALTAVIGGEAVTDLGYEYVLLPILLNAFSILALAILFNYAFRWRRYPAYLYFRRAESTPKVASSEREFELTQEDLSAAIQKHDSFVDITEAGLTDLLELAKQHAELNMTHPSEISTGRYYSNGKLGRLWGVRQVLDSVEGRVLPSKDKVIYKVIAGHPLYETGICLRSEFRDWARFEVIQNDGRWIKLTPDSSEK